MMHTETQMRSLLSLPIAILTASLVGHMSLECYTNTCSCGVGTLYGSMRFMVPQIFTDRLCKGPPTQTTQFPPVHVHAMAQDNLSSTSIDLTTSPNGALFGNRWTAQMQTFGLRKFKAQIASSHPLQSPYRSLQRNALRMSGTAETLG